MLQLLEPPSALFAPGMVVKVLMNLISSSLGGLQGKKGAAVGSSVGAQTAVADTKGQHQPVTPGTTITE